jgi:molybdopterin-containing oxidoreductase family membrane subunit
VVKQNTGKDSKNLSLVLAGLATPLVFSVHTTVSFDFATSVIKGWHSTIYPPYFVAGAIFSGFAMVQTLY